MSPDSWCHVRWRTFPDWIHLDWHLGTGDFFRKVLSALLHGTAKKIIIQKLNDIFTYQRDIYIFESREIKNGTKY